METKKPKIIIIEDNEVLRKAMASYIEASDAFEFVEAFHNCETALESFNQLAPNLVLMDIDLPGMNGVAGTKVIKRKYPKTEVLIVTVFENSKTVFDALSAGATGYLTKTFTPESLLAAIKECFEGGAPMSTSVAKMVVNSFNKNTNDSPLSHREQDVLNCLAQGQSYNSIAESLYISLATVKYHIKNIYIKLEVSSREEALQKARNENYI